MLYCSMPPLRDAPSRGRTGMMGEVQDGRDSVSVTRMGPSRNTHLETRERIVDPGVRRFLSPRVGRCGVGHGEGSIERASRAFSAEISGSDLPGKVSGGKCGPIPERPHTAYLCLIHPSGCTATLLYRTQRESRCVSPRSNPPTYPPEADLPMLYL